MAQIPPHRVAAPIGPVQRHTIGNSIPVLYQNGYLIIKGYDRDMRIYTLGFLTRGWNVASLTSCSPIIRQ